jgi:hypothetical protein
MHPYDKCLGGPFADLGAMNKIYCPRQVSNRGRPVWSLSLTRLEEDLGREL